jgi:AraC-like DNA-binding protein
MDFIEGITVVSFVIAITTVYCFYLRKIKFISVLFYFSWFFVFFSLLLSTTPKFKINESLVSAFALLFFVWLILLPPLLYNLINNEKQKTNIVLSHFYLPSILFLINLFSIVFFSLNNETEKNFAYEVVENVMTYVNYIVILFIFPISTVYYSFVSYQLLFNNNEFKNESYFKSNLFVFILLYNLFICFWFLNYLLDSPTLKMIIKSWFILYFPISLFVIYKAHSKKAEKINPLELINEKLIYLFNTEHMYLEPELTIRKLARKIGTNEKYLSNVINKVHNQNFSVFINNYRIENAKKLLLDSNYENLTLEAIGSLSGFNSKSSFNSVFKKTTGLTPTEYKTKAPVS